MSKGLAIGLLVFLIFMVFILEAGLSIFLLNRTNYSRASAMETNIIQGIDDFTLKRRYLEQAMEYSVYQASYEVFQNGGYSNISDADSFDCLPYLEVYGTENTPDIYGNIAVLATNYFNEYSIEISDDETAVPDYEIFLVNGMPNILARTDGKLEMVKEGKMKVSDDSEIRIVTPTVLFGIEDNIHTSNAHVSELVSDSVDYAHFEEQLADYSDNLNSGMAEPSETTIFSSEMISGDGTTFSARVLVDIKSVKEYPVYNRESEANEMLPLEFRYYILVSNDPSLEIGPETNICNR
jgi:hypothetical protein